MSEGLGDHTKHSTGKGYCSGGCRDGLQSLGILNEPWLTLVLTADTRIHVWGELITLQRAKHYSGYSSAPCSSSGASAEYTTHIYIYIYDRTLLVGSRRWDNSSFTPPERLQSQFWPILVFPVLCVLFFLLFFLFLGGGTNQASTRQVSHVSLSCFEVTGCPRFWFKQNPPFRGSDKYMSPLACRSGTRQMVVWIGGDHLETAEKFRVWTLSFGPSRWESEIGNRRCWSSCGAPPGPCPAAPAARGWCRRPWRWPPLGWARMPRASDVGFRGTKSEKG